MDPVQVMHREQDWDGCDPWRGPRQLCPRLPHLCYNLLLRLPWSARGRHLQRVSLSDGALQAPSVLQPQLQCAVCSVASSQGMLHTVELCSAATVHNKLA